jgi:hypothetical protein
MITAEPSSRLSRYSQKTGNEVMLPEQNIGTERPRAVTIIGRLSLVVAVFGLCKNLVNLAIWKTLEPDAPSLFRNALAETPRFLHLLLAHAGALMTVQALWWAFVVIAAIGLLRLRPWARVAFQGICWAVLAYATLFGIFWTAVWPTLPARGASAPAAPAESYRVIGLVFGLTTSAAVAAGLITMIALLRRPKVREAFDRGGEFLRK